MERGIDDIDLLTRSVQEPSAFAGLYERHNSAVHRYVARRVGATAAEDLGAEVFVRAFRSREGCRVEHGSALPCLLGVANHVIGDHRRVERRRLVALERLAHDCQEAVEHPDSALAPALAHALGQMPERDRDALLLVVWGELSYEETATALNVSVGTIGSRIYRARRRLAAVLGPPAPSKPAEYCLRGEADA